VPFEFT
jgi:hypothetical protein